MRTMTTNYKRALRPASTMLPAAAALIIALGAAAMLPAAEHHDRTMLYIPNAADGTVAAVDVDAGELLWELQISEDTNGRPAEAAHGIAVASDGATLYAGDRAAGKLVVVDLKNRQIRKRVEIAHGVHGIDISPDGTTVWVAGSSPDMFWLGEISVFDTTTQEIIAHVAPGVGSAEHIGFAPDGSEVWVASVSNNLVWTVDPLRNELSSVIAVPQRSGESDAPEAEAGLIGINEVAVAPDGQRAYAVGPASARVFAIDAVARTVLESVRGEPRAHGVAVSPNGREVWVANRSGSVSVFDADTLESLATISTGEYANHVAIHPDGRRAFVTGRDELLVIDTAKRVVLERIAIGADPHEIAVSVGPARAAE